MSPDQRLKLTPLSGSTGMQPITIGVLMTAHNRCVSTLRCLQALTEQRVAAPSLLAIVLVDDASRDGTGAAVRRRFPEVNVIDGNGNLYWGGGMRLAQTTLTASLQPDYLLWLNDDVVLFPDALETLLAAAAVERRALIVGALVDPQTQQTSYSGLRRSGRSPLRLSMVVPSATLQEVDTFNGNVLLVPQSAYVSLGAVDASFPHTYGDLDYGYRARSSGIQILLAPGHLGSCDRNDNTADWRDPSLGRRLRLRRLHSTKVMPLRPRLVFLRRHGGIEWSLRLLAGYVKEYKHIVRSGKP